MLMKKADMVSRGGLELYLHKRARSYSYIEGGGAIATQKGTGL